MMGNIIFPLNFLNYNDEVSYYIVACSNDYWLWHFRFGHLHFSCLRLLQQKQMVRWLPPINQSSNTCECCILGKKHCEIFPKGVAYRAKQPLELVHTDLCGPMRTQSIGGSCYFLTFIDDYKRKTWVYSLKQKSETFAKFKEFKALAEKQSDRQIKVLRSDRGG